MYRLWGAHQAREQDSSVYEESEGGEQEVDENQAKLKLKWAIKNLAEVGWSPKDIQEEVEKQLDDTFPVEEEV